MIFSESQLNYVTGIAKELPAPMLSMMIKSTVRLNVKKKKGAFWASGVIFNVATNTVEILTAAHNLMSAQDLSVPPDDWTELADDFLTNLTVSYGPKDSKFNGAPQVSVKLDKKTDSIVVPDIVSKCHSKDKAPDCYYDLAVIKVVNTKLADFTKTFLDKSYKLTEVAKYASAQESSFLDKSKNLYFQLGYGTIEETRTPKSEVKRRVEGDKGKTVEEILIAEGPVEEAKCGKTEKDNKPIGMTAYQLHYRIARPLNADYTCFYDQIAEGGKAPAYSANCAAIELGASKNNTTAPGDSGGPLYAIGCTEVEKVNPQTQAKELSWTFQKASLLGLTTGSDMQPAEKLTVGVFKNDIVTSVIPYLETRTKG